MEGFKRYAVLICSILILILAIIHLGVSSSVVGKFRHYDDVFRPEVGLAAFNIVISIFALLIGGFGLFSALTHRGNLGKLIGLISIVLAIFVLASLITALIINSMAINYVDSRFSNHMDRYEMNRNSRDIVDRIQTKYTCCGSDTWLEWTRVSLNATTTTIATTTTTTTTTVTTNTTVVVNVTETTTTTPETTTVMTTTDLTTITDTEGEDSTTEESTASDSLGNERAIGDVEDSDGRIERSILEENVRERRQARVNYGDIHNLPADFVVTFPASCCTKNLASINSLSNPYCFSNANNGFHTDGCARKLGKDAVGQTLGLAVINSLLLILTLAAIYLFTKDPTSTTYPQAVPMNEHTHNQYGQQNGGYSANNYNHYGYQNQAQPMYPIEYQYTAPPSAYSAVPSQIMYY